MGQRILLALRRLLHRSRGRRGVRLNPWLTAAVIGICLACSGIGMLELRLRPVVEELAALQVHNRVTGDINTALSDLSVDYESLVNTTHDQQGTVLAITTDMSVVNRLRTLVTEQVLAVVADINVHELGVPLGSLFDIDLAWAKGPAIQVHSLVAGTVQTQVRSEFASSGINQTLHRILLDVTVPLTVLLPGISVDTQVTAQVCLAETVIVGRVPQTLLGLPQRGSTEG